MPSWGGQKHYQSHLQEKLTQLLNVWGETELWNGKFQPKWLKPGKAVVDKQEGGPWWEPPGEPTAAWTAPAWLGLPACSATRQPPKESKGEMWAAAILGCRNWVDARVDVDVDVDVNVNTDVHIVYM